jgi:hypothetical protein
MEMMDQPNAICKALNYGARFKDGGLVKLGGLESNEDELMAIDNLYLLVRKYVP